MSPTKETIQLSVNGKKQNVEVAPETPLLYVLRHQFELNGPKYGCGLGQCGACMVLLDKRPAMSCVLPVSQAKGKNIITLAGLVKDNGSLHPVQQAFVDEQAAQCGYCTNGMVISAIFLLDQNPNPDEEEIRQALQANLCRCGSQSRVIRAVHRAAQS